MTTQTAGNLAYLDPTSLLTDRNIRTDTDLDHGFVASVREHGVIVPIVAVHTPDGIRVHAGHRRTAAAVAAGLSAVPVLVLDEDPSRDESARIIQQLVENHHRTALTTADTLAAVQQLAILGCTPASIARRTKISRKAVGDALAAANSDLGTRAARDLPALTIEHLSWLAEFDDDPETSADLLDTFTNRPEQARHAVERARQARTLTAARETAYQQVGAAHPGSSRYDAHVYNDPAAKHLRDLTDPDGDPLTPDGHDGCPGDAYTLTHLAWATEDTDGVIWADGHGFRIDWLCSDYATHGHLDRYAHHHGADPTATTDAEHAAQARAQRRRTVVLNRAGEAATEVRREWLTQFTTRKTAPKDAAAFMLAGLAHGHPAATHEAGHGLHQITAALGVDNLTDWMATQTPARIAHIHLCARLWAYEARTDKTIWREGRRFGAYLSALAAWGYTLSDAERVAVDDLTEDQALALLTQQ